MTLPALEGVYRHIPSLLVHAALAAKPVLDPPPSVSEDSSTRTHRQEQLERLSQNLMDWLEEFWYAEGKKDYRRMCSDAVWLRVKQDDFDKLENREYCGQNPAFVVSLLQHIDTSTASGDLLAGLAKTATQYVMGTHKRDLLPEYRAAIVKLSTELRQDQEKCDKILHYALMAYPPREIREFLLTSWCDVSRQDDSHVRDILWSGLSDLGRAVARGDVETVRRQCSRIEWLQSDRPRRMQALHRSAVTDDITHSFHIAVCANEREIAELLLKRMRNNSEYTVANAVPEAAERGYHDMLEWLLTHIVDMNMLDGVDETPVWSRVHDEKSAEILAKYFAPNLDRLTHIKDLAILRYVVSNGLVVDYVKFSDDCYDWDGLSTNLPVLRYLYASGVLLNRPCDWLVACELGHTAKVKILLEAGYDTNKVYYPKDLQVEENYAPSFPCALLTAVYYGHTDVMSLLLSHGADPNLVLHGQSEDYTPLRCAVDGMCRGSMFIACPEFRVQELRLLVANGADVNKKWGRKKPNSLTSYVQRRLSDGSLGEFDEAERETLQSILVYLESVNAGNKVDTTE